jgi:molybdopterin synthase catalytic subunit
MSQDWIELLSQPLSTASAVEFVTSSAAGGIAVFAGITRRETGTTGELVALNYEAYPDMAIAQMRDLVAESRKKWELAKVVLLHRVGRVAVSEPSVVIAVSAAHRGPALEACRWLIDELKKVVTIWKQDVWMDGSTSWVDGNTVDSAKKTPGMPGG